MYCLIRIALVWLCLAAHSAARDIYVSNTAGDDRRDGADARAQLPRHGPLRTISKALRLTRPGDRINTGVARNKLFGRLHPLIARPDYLVNIPDSLSVISHCCHRLNAANTIDFCDSQFTTNC